MRKIFGQGPKTEPDLKSKGVAELVLNILNGGQDGSLFNKLLIGCDLPRYLDKETTIDDLVLSVKGKANLGTSD